MEVNKIYYSSDEVRHIIHLENSITYFLLKSEHDCKNSYECKMVFYDIDDLESLLNAVEYQRRNKPNLNFDFSIGIKVVTVKISKRSK